MKYYFLKAWEQEIEQVSRSIEALNYQPELLTLSFKHGLKLCIVLSARDAFPFFSRDFIVADNARPLWPILVNTQCRSISLAEGDRILYLDIIHRDIYQQQLNYVLIAELISPKPNLILAIRNGEELKIHDAIHKYGYADNPQRQILPGWPYIPPTIKTSFPPEAPITVFPDGGSSCNNYFQWHYHQVFSRQQDKDWGLHQKSILHQQLQKLNKKLEKQQAELKEAGQADYFLACAEALKPNLPNIQSGQSSVCTTNYLDPALGEIIIPLLKDKSPRDNLKNYLKKYHKAKNGLARIQENIIGTISEIDELQALLQRVENGKTLALNLDKKDDAGSIRVKENQLSKLLQYKVNEDWQIVIGRKAKENDFITTQLAKPHDWWFHSRIYHGAHVLLRCLRKKDPDDRLIEICASLAAWYSKAKFSTNVPVDYTQIRFVRKPRKSAPGFVTYTNFKSVYASPMDIRAVREKLNSAQNQA